MMDTPSSTKPSSEAVPVVCLHNILANVLGNAARRVILVGMPHVLAEHGAHAGARAQLGMARSARSEEADHKSDQFNLSEKKEGLTC